MGVQEDYKDFQKKLNDMGLLSDREVDAISDKALELTPVSGEERGSIMIEALKTHEEDSDA